MNWQTMDTAPKDGRDILVFNNDGVTIGWWDPNTKRWCHQYSYLGIDDLINWMPLPLPPNVSRETQEWD